jgi:hypothetical protein
MLCDAAATEATGRTNRALPPAILDLYRMDVDRTIEFILQQQAKAETEMAAMRQQQAKAEARQAQAEVKAERQMAAIRKLIQTGMRMIVKNEELVKVTQAELRELAAVQKVTETKLQGLIDALRRGRNGSHRKN